MIPRSDVPARVTATEQLSPSCFRLLLHAPVQIDPRPGQFAMLACSPSFDPLLRRAFSIAGARRLSDGTELEVMVKRVGRGTGCLGRSRPGDEVAVLAPLGNGFTLECDGRLALLAGGIGLPPLLFAAEVLARRGSPFDLFAGAATGVELLAEERCAAAADTVGGELVATTDDGTRGEAGLVTAALERRLDSGRRYARVLACGPSAMLKAAARLAVARGLEAELSLEEPMACGVGVCLGCVVELEDGSFVPSCKEGPVFPVGRLAARWWS